MKAIFTQSYIFDIGIFVLLVSLNVLLMYLKGYITNEAIVDDSDLKYMNLAKVISAILVVPLIEEFFFRGYLCLDKKYCIVLFSFAAIFMAYSLFDKSLLPIIFILIFSIVMFFFGEINLCVNKFIHTNVIIFIILSSILFGVMHFTNYDKFEYVNLLVIFPKILVGIFLSYITLKYNIFYAYALHGINNVIPFVLIYFYSIK